MSPRKNTAIFTILLLLLTQKLTITLIQIWKKSLMMPLLGWRLKVRGQKSAKLKFLLGLDDRSILECERSK